MVICILRRLSFLKGTKLWVFEGKKKEAVFICNVGSWGPMIVGLWRAYIINAENRSISKRVVSNFKSEFLKIHIYN